MLHNGSCRSQITLMNLCLSFGVMKVRLCLLTRLGLLERMIVIAFLSPSLITHKADSFSSLMCQSESIAVRLTSCSIHSIAPFVNSSGLSNKPIKWSGKDELKSVELQCYSTSRAVEGKSRCKAFFIHVSTMCLYAPEHKLWTVL